MIPIPQQALLIEVGWQDSLHAGATWLLPPNINLSKSRNSIHPAVTKVPIQEVSIPVMTGPVATTPTPAPTPAAITTPQDWPTWSRKAPFKYLVSLDPKRQRINPNTLGNVVIISIISGLGLILYASSLAGIYTLSSNWKICPTSEAAATPGTLSTPPATQPLQAQTTNQAGASLSPLPPTASMPQPDLKQVFAAIDNLGGTISTNQKYRLKSQLIQFQQVQHTSCGIGVFFFANRNATLSVATAAALLSVASLAFVSKNGWEGTNNLFITIGLSSGLILFSTWTFSQLYGQGANYENQKTKVALATDMLNRIASATANQSNASIVKSIDANGTAKTIVVNLTNPKDFTILTDALDDQLRVLTNLDFTSDSSFAEQSAKRFGDMIQGGIKTVAPLPAPGPAPR